jgi:hypothetical protein
MAPFTKMELFSHSLNGLKSMKDHLIIFSAYHTHNIGALKNHSGRFWRLKKNGTKILLDSVQNLYASIARINAAVLKVKVVQHYVNKETQTVSVVFPLFCPPLVFFHAGFTGIESMKMRQEHQTSET